MIRKQTVVAVVTLLLIVPGVGALDFAGDDLIIPVVARVDGAMGSRWQTDLFVTNVSREAIVVPVTIILHREGFPDQTINTQLGRQASLVLADLLLASFGHETAAGMIRIRTSSAEKRLTAWARIYNIGSAAGEYGQSVQAIPSEKLDRELFLPALNGVDGNRANIGISNPGTATVTATLSISNENGDSRGSRSVAVGPSSVLQINDVFTFFGIAPVRAATVRVNAIAPVYAWASIVRGDSGDASFLIGSDDGRGGGDDDD